MTNTDGGGRSVEVLERIETSLRAALAAFPELQEADDDPTAGRQAAAWQAALDRQAERMAEWHTRPDETARLAGTVDEEWAIEERRLRDWLDDLARVARRSAEGV